MAEYKGVCTFHSETGTEGGYWAMQDEKFMGLKGDDEYSCIYCGTIWNRTREPENPPGVKFIYTIRNNEGERVTMSYDEPHPELAASPDNDRYNNMSNAQARVCHQRGHKGWQEVHPDGIWSYEGLHVLKDGDHLTVYSKSNPDEVVWEGEIKLKQHDLFTEDAAGLWIHADQEGIDRDTWAGFFFQEHPCKLVTKDE